MDESDLAYAAGIIDGEGSISIFERPQHKGNRNPSFRLSIRVSMTDPVVPYWLKEQFGGSVAYKEWANTKWKPVYTWTFVARKAYELSLELLPHLKTKRQQAELAIRLYEGGPFGGSQHGRRLPEDELARRRALKDEIQALNHRGTINSAT